jgi:hypothetical protein
MKEEARDLPGGAEPEPATNRTTVRPPFDPEQFARESDSMIGVDAEPPSERPTTPPPPGLPLYTPGMPPSFAEPGSDVIPTLAVAREDLEWFELTDIARDLLEHFDGRSTLALICAQGGFALDAALAVCRELSRQGIVTLHRESSTSG